MPNADVERLVDAELLAQYSEGGQVGHFMIDWTTLHSISAGKMADANDLLYSMVEKFPEYEFMVEERFVPPGVMISWRVRKEQNDGNRKEGAPSKGGTSAGPAEDEADSTRGPYQSNGRLSASVLDGDQRI